MISSHDVASNTRPTVMVVDDTPANLELLCNLLRQRGYRVRPVPSGRLALMAARAEAPDIVLMDISMPDLDGYQTCEAMRADDELHDVPVIFVSALGETVDKVRSFAAGGVDYVTKPFQIDEVEARVRTHLQLRRQKIELRESYERLQQMEVLRDRLVHMVVHDLRNPLMALCACLDVLHETESGLSPSGARTLSTAMASGQELLEMIGTILDVSRMESDAMPIQAQPLELGGLLQEVLERLGGLQAARTVEVDVPRPLHVRTDPQLLRRVLRNLVANAFQVTRAEGTVHVRMAAENDCIRVSVEDDGPGIPREQHDRLFSQFLQLEGPRKMHGSGLGLRFCQLAVQALGGRIGVESESGQGAIFWFTLPAEVNAA